MAATAVKLIIFKEGIEELCDCTSLILAELNLLTDLVSELCFFSFVKLDEFIATSQDGKLLSFDSFPDLVVLLTNQVSEVLEFVLALLDRSNSG